MLGVSVPLLIVAVNAENVRPNIPRESVCRALEIGALAV
jgi:hypothetical protein